MPTRKNSSEEVDVVDTNNIPNNIETTAANTLVDLRVNPDEANDAASHKRKSTNDISRHRNDNSLGNQPNSTIASATNRIVNTSYSRYRNVPCNRCICF